jgi:hypothetical protein
MVTGWAMCLHPACSPPSKHPPPTPPPPLASFLLTVQTAPCSPLATAVSPPFFPPSIVLTLPYSPPPLIPLTLQTVLCCLQATARPHTARQESSIPTSILMMEPCEKI